MTSLRCDLLLLPLFDESCAITLSFSTFTFYIFITYYIRFSRFVEIQTILSPLTDSIVMRHVMLLLLMIFPVHTVKKCLSVIGTLSLYASTLPLRSLSSVGTAAEVFRRLFVCGL